MKQTLGLILAWICIFQADAKGWGYEADTGPDNWEVLFPDACSGRHQSPIDIKSTQTVYNPALKDFAIFFDPPAPGSKFYVHNNGHSIQVNTEGRFYVSNGGLTDIYSTAQFHFHWGHKSHHGSEHTLDGTAAPIEMHIVNWNSDRYSGIGEAAVKPGGLAVLGILFEVSREDNPLLESLVDVLLHVRDPDMKIKAEIPAVSMRAFLPRAPDRYYRYNGSLTTPGCFESVVWTVFEQKQTISRRQLQVFRQVLKPSHSHHHKRSVRSRQARAVQEVLQEIGIEDNAVEKRRFKRQLEKEMTAANETTIVVEEVPLAAEAPMKTPMETVTEAQPSGGHHDHHSGHEVKPVPISAGSDTHTYDVTQSNAEKVRKMLVNNYRPVQPLNGRTVYRSFPFFDEPITSDTEVVYIDRSTGNGSSSIKLMSLVSLVFSILALKFL